MNSDNKISQDKLVLDLLEQAFYIIENPAYWTQGKSRIYDPLSSHYCYCSVGALAFVCYTGMFPDDRETGREVMFGAYEILTESIRDTTHEHNQQLAAFNDTHTHEEVCDVWRDAIRKQRRIVGRE